MGGLNGMGNLGGLNMGQMPQSMSVPQAANPQALALFQAMFQSEKGVQLLSHLTQIMHGLRGVAECLQSEPFVSLDSGLVPSQLTPNQFGNPAFAQFALGQQGLMSHQGKQMKKPRDPNAPKAPMSSYLLFCHDERPKLKELMPDHDQKSIAVELGRRWKELSDEQKIPYEEAAKKLRDEYNIAMAQYNRQRESGAGSPGQS